jgi:hypothetical protein
MTRKSPKKTIDGFKLFTLRKDGTIGPLFINRKLRIELGKWYEAEDHPTKGYAHRPGWHCTTKKCAPHLSTKGRVWAKVKMQDCKKFERPQSQGGTWILAQRMKVVEILEEE